MSQLQETIYNEVFISYSRENIEFAQRVVQAIYDSGRENVWIDWEDIEYAEDWWQKIQAGIESAYNFIFILTPDSAKSQVCYDEVEHAIKSGKRIIPIVHIEVKDKADLAQMHPTISQHNWLPFKENDDFEAGMKQLILTIEKDLAHVHFHTRLQTRARQWEDEHIKRDDTYLVSKGKLTESQAWFRARGWENEHIDPNERNEAYLLSTGELTEAQAWLARTELEDKHPTPTPLQHNYIAASQTAENERQSETKRIAHLVKKFQRTSNRLTVVAIMAIVATIIAIVFGLNTQRQITELTGIVLGATQGARWEEWSSQLDIEARSQIVREGVMLERNFDGVTMVFVPTGCFMMGDDDYSFRDEKPVHEICFEESFWIDKYEVTNEQYGSVGGCSDYSLESNQPRNCVSWFEANEFCQSREARLPTEAEWEYTARGPDNLIYPWGNEFVAENVAYGNLVNRPADVGSYPAGASWVGAEDMSGNILEWTSTIYDEEEFPYPYSADDGREDLNRTGVQHVLRGGTFNGASSSLRAASRISSQFIGISISGFRCARSYE